MLRGAGRVVLWAALGLILLAGLRDIANPEENQPARAAGEQTAKWPDPEAEAYAAQFTRAYLTFSPKRPEYAVEATRPYLSNSLRDEDPLELPQRGGVDQQVESTNVARVKRIDRDHALITVAATVIARTVSTRYLTVPVARTKQAGLVVFDFPSFASPPRRGNEQLRIDALEGDEASDIISLLRRFFRQYLAGQPADELSYFLTSDARVTPLGQGLELVDAKDFTQVGKGAGRSRTVIATLRVRDPETRATYLQRFRVEVVRRDRWYVTSIQGSTNGGR